MLLYQQRTSMGIQSVGPYCAAHSHGLAATKPPVYCQSCPFDFNSMGLFLLSLYCQTVCRSVTQKASHTRPTTILQ